MGYNQSIEDRKASIALKYNSIITRSSKIDEKLKEYENLLNVGYQISQDEINKLLIEASQYDRPDMVLFLVKYGANVNYVTIEFVAKFLLELPQNYPLIFSLHDICNISNIVGTKQINNIINKIRHQLVKYLNKNTSNIVYEYMKYNEIIN